MEAPKNLVLVAVINPTKGQVTTTVLYTMDFGPPQQFWLFYVGGHGHSLWRFSVLDLWTRNLNNIMLKYVFSFFLVFQVGVWQDFDFKIFASGKLVYQEISRPLGIPLAHRKLGFGVYIHPSRPHSTTRQSLLFWCKLH